jgi:hypothetical protein
MGSMSVSDKVDVSSVRDKMIFYSYREGLRESPPSLNVFIVAVDLLGKIAGWSYSCLISQLLRSPLSSFTNSRLHVRRFGSKPALRASERAANRGDAFDSLITYKNRGAN